MSAYVLVQLQLSNYTPDGKFVLTADSNWQIFVAKCVQMIKADPYIRIDVIVPGSEQCLEDPTTLLADAGIQRGVNVNPISLHIMPSAPATRYDFPYVAIKNALSNSLKEYTHVYINDPMLLPHYKALFHLNKAKPKFILQTHFLDSPVAQIVDSELSYWYGTVDACSKADIFLWHSISMENEFRVALSKEFRSYVIGRMMTKSIIWKDGFSIEEIHKPINVANLRFYPEQLIGKTVIWVPNRVGGLGKSFDYTNNGKFLFEIVPELWKCRQDFIVLAGNPNQKISNDEIAEKCPAYVKLVPGALNRDEYRWLSRRANIVVGLYTIDRNGGLASLEAIDHHATPFFPDIHEYKTYFGAVDWPQHLRIKPDLSDAVDVMSRLLDEHFDTDIIIKRQKMKQFIREYAAYEHTTLPMMKRLGLV